jgi:hypothetical protein
MEADKVVLDRAAVIEVSSLLFGTRKECKLTNRPQLNAYPQSAQPTLKLERSKLVSHQHHPTSLDRTERLEDKDCLGKWVKRRGVSGWSGLERRIRSRIRSVLGSGAGEITIEDMHVSRTTSG